MKTFKGYYFRHQNAQETLALIPGATEKGAFIQVITEKWARSFDFPDAVFGETVRIGKNTFGHGGIHVDLPGIRGDIQYAHLTPISSDIMGPFRFFPMECRHRIVSMRHDLTGTVEWDGVPHSFDGGTGYWEGDSGRSFPKEYLWVAANDFPDGSSFVLSVAEIPFAGMHFRGVICVLMNAGKEYRLATYRGAKATVEDNHITVRQGNAILTCDVLPGQGVYQLSSPINGQMSGRIWEDNTATVRVTLRCGAREICDLFSRRAGYERHPLPRATSAS